MAILKTSFWQYLPTSLATFVQASGYTGWLTKPDSHELGFMHATAAVGCVAAAEGSFTFLRFPHVSADDGCVSAGR